MWSPTGVETLKRHATRGGEAAEIVSHGSGYGGHLSRACQGIFLGMAGTESIQVLRNIIGRPPVEHK